MCCFLHSEKGKECVCFLFLGWVGPIIIVMRLDISLMPNDNSY